LDATGIIAGSLDGPTGLKTIGHIFVGVKPDFCEIVDDLPQFEFSSNGELVNDYKSIMHAALAACLNSIVLSASVKD